jgi:dolichol kinase
MNSSIIYNTKTFAIELYFLLKELDPLRWTDKKVKIIKGKVYNLENNINIVYKEIENSTHSFVQKHKSDYLIFKEKLNHLNELLDELKVYYNQSEIKKEYINSIRKKLERNYYELSALLEKYSLKIPMFRPTNYARSIFHMLSAIITLFVIQIIPSTLHLTYISFFLFLSVWSMEILVRKNNKAKEKIMNFFMPVAHLHEEEKINSATWYSTALLIISLSQSKMICSIAVIVLGLADPLAGIVGRKFGKIRLVGGRSLEGSLTFILVGALSTFFLLNIFYSSLDIVNIYILSIMAGIFGAIGELFGGTIDDNITIPVTITLGIIFITLLIM